ncbi:RidA family protein [Pseudonocardia xishanensis]|uniref:Enamine deaminase RidA (YjgF/YER057c/UK114 family) n=1 Tax=Pseudonocardia xishanensis TaxID=630995 RepID=A0ABP8RUV8_9PSEU
MRRRTSVTVDGIDHGSSPFPAATRIGPFIFSSALSGRDADSGVLPDSVEKQAETAFENVRRVVTAAGASPEDIAKVVVFARDRAAVRAVLDGPWTALFPDPGSRPVRHTVEAEIPAHMHLQVEFVAVQEENTA